MANSFQHTYAQAGVDYEALDTFKRLAQEAASNTGGNIARADFSDVSESRGESAYLMEAPDYYLAHVEEGLGTKVLVADAMRQLTGKSYYASIAQDAVAAIVNDMATLGARPLSVAMHIAAGSSAWFKDAERVKDLVDGWKRACDLAQCVWGGGETPALKDVVAPATAVIGGSAVGIIKPKTRRLSGARIQHGDAIVLVRSSGIHANGVSFARMLAEKLSDGYLTKLRNGRTFGEALLDPAPIYSALVDRCFENRVDLHYAVHITGHGWRKLMRAREPFAYVIDRVPDAPDLFTFMQEHGPISEHDAYSTFNMGAGFALYVPETDVEKILNVAQHFSGQFSVIHAGFVEQSSEKKVVIKPKHIEFSARDLRIR